MAADVNDPMHYAHVEHTGAASDRSPRPAVVHAGSLALVALLASPAVGAALPARAQDPSVSFASSPFDLDLDERAAAAVDPPPAAASAAAEASEPPKSTPAGPPPPHTGVIATLKAVPGDFTHLPSKHTLAVLAGGGALALAAHPFDKDTNTRLQSSSFAKTFFTPGKWIGESYTLIGASFAVYGIGRASDNRALSHLGMDLLRSTLEDAAIVYAVKISVRRPRPTGECCSFPSGHASVTMAAAAVLWRHLGWKAAVPTYTVASYVALSRLRDNRHYLSDVLFGSAVGVAVGHTVTLHTLKGHENWAVVPMPMPGGGFGVMVSAAP